MTEDRLVALLAGLFWLGLALVVTFPLWLVAKLYKLGRDDT